MRVFPRLLIAIALLSAAPAAAAGPELKTEDDKVLYAVGLTLAQKVGVFYLTPAEYDLVIAGLKDGLSNTAKIELTQYGGKINDLARQRSAKVAEAEKKESGAFLEKLAKEKGAEKAASGMIYIPVKTGTGASPKATDNVKVHYKGTLRDGSTFDSSIERGQPATFVLNRVIPCWTEGLQKMKVGGSAKLACPSAIAYGDNGRPPKIKPGAALLFEVELLSIEAAPPAPPAGTPAGHP